MSELTNTKSRNVRNGLLTSASVFALLGIVWASPGALAASGDDDRPIIWIELGGQLERVDNPQAIFSPPFFDKAQASVLAPMVDAQLPPHYSIGGEGKLTFAPHDSNWVFSVSMRYGRSNAARHLHYETRHPVVPQTIGGAVIGIGFNEDAFGDGQSGLSESHFIADFQAGKDVGLGLFGRGSTSILSAGVRFAQFTSNSDVRFLARPVYHSLPPFGQPGKYNIHDEDVQNNTAVVQSRRSVQAIGPEVSWDASLPVAGNDSSMTVAFDWGVNAAILFGRQRAHVHHQTTGAYYTGVLAGLGGYRGKVSSYVHGPYEPDRARTVTIPNVGGFAGVSFRYLDAKVSFGYRADFFFGAMDGGIDAARKTNIGFYGPFASVSVGIGG